MASKSASTPAPLTFDLPASLIDKVQSAVRSNGTGPKSVSEVVRQAVVAFDFDGYNPPRRAGARRARSAAAREGEENRRQEAALSAFWRTRRRRALSTRLRVGARGCTVVTAIGIAFDRSDTFARAVHDHATAPSLHVGP